MKVEVDMAEAVEQHSFPPRNKVQIEVVIHNSFQNNMNHIFDLLKV